FRMRWLRWYLRRRIALHARWEVSAIVSAAPTVRISVVDAIVVAEAVVDTSRAIVVDPVTVGGCAGFDHGVCIVTIWNIRVVTLGHIIVRVAVSVAIAVDTFHTTSFFGDTDGVFFTVDIHDIAERPFGAGFALGTIHSTVVPII